MLLDLIYVRSDIVQASLTSSYVLGYSFSDHFHYVPCQVHKTRLIMIFLITSNILLFIIFQSKVFSKLRQNCAILGYGNRVLTNVFSPSLLHATLERHVAIIWNVKWTQDVTWAQKPFTLMGKPTCQQDNNSRTPGRTDNFTYSLWFSSSLPPYFLLL